MVSFINRFLINLLVNIIQYALICILTSQSFIKLRLWSSNRLQSAAGTTLTWPRWQCTSSRRVWGGGGGGRPGRRAPPCTQGQFSRMENTFRFLKYSCKILVWIPKKSAQLFLKIYEFESLNFQGRSGSPVCVHCTNVHFIDPEPSFLKFWKDLNVSPRYIKKHSTQQQHIKLDFNATSMLRRFREWELR